MHRNSYFAVALIGTLLSTPVMAQWGMSLNFGGGASLPAYNTGDRHDTGWNAAVGLAINPDPHLGFRLEFQDNQFNVNRSTLDVLSFPDGQTRVWSLTLNPVIRFHPTGHLNFYLIGGGGLFHRTSEFTQPLITTTTVYDPFFNYFYRVAVPVNEIIESHSVAKPGWNAGAGFAIPFARDGKTALYFEARYNQMYTQPILTTYLPVTVGLRF